MFVRLFQYKVKRLFRTKDELFWCLVFPLILGTFFYMSFGGFQDKQETFQAINIGYITTETGKDEDFDQVLMLLSKDGKDQIVRIKTTKEEEAKKLLLDKKIAGIIYNTLEITLTVNGEGINESILNSFLNQYIQKRETFTKIAQISPDKLNEVLELEFKDSSYLQEIRFTNASIDPMTSYYYALIAMTCLYGCFAGLSSAIDIKANMSTLAPRRLVAPTNKMKIILGDFFGAVFVQFICTLITVCYIIFVLKVDMGQKINYLMLTAFVGSLIGVTTGLFIGSIGRQSENVKSAIVLAGTMVECFLSGLMVGNMKDIVERHAPIINRINPATLIVDSLYSLDIYDTYDRYMRNMISMLILATILCIGSFLAIRRERYASI